MSIYTDSAEHGLGEMVRGVLEDFQDLARQQMQMFRAECRADWHRAKAAFLSVALAVPPLLLATVLLSFMLVHFIYWIGSPAAQAAAVIPLWGCYGIVGGLLAGIGVCLLIVGLHKMRSLDPLPKESLQTLEENVQWLTKRI